MLKNLKKSWFALSLILVALSVAYASCGRCNKGKSKPDQIVLDKLVNELVCKAPKLSNVSKAPKLGMVKDKILSKIGDKYWT